MTNFTLYRKEIQMLEITKRLFQAGKYHGGYRESIDELFYENDQHFRREFLNIIPVENLEWIKNLLSFLKTVDSSSRRGSQTFIKAMYFNERNATELIAEITKLQELIETQCNERFNFGVFYSWQSDTDTKFNRNFIEDSLKKSIKEANRRKPYGPFLSLDKDTRGVPGSPDIVTTILQKIDRSVCFVADVTPITEKNGKKICNPNVMFELGYALSSLSFERIVIICNTSYCKINELPFDLGLRRVIPYNYDGNTLKEKQKEVKEKLTETLRDAMISIANL